jgi:uncharacterized protein (TIGR02145 family)
MNNRIILSIVILFTLLFVLFHSCKKLEKSMLVSTGDVTNILANSADASGLVVDLGDDATQHGHCYGISPNVTTAGSKTQLGTPPVGGFTSQLANLTAGTKYYIKAYLSNGSETVYGKEISFTTVAASLASIATAEVTSITTTSTSCGGNITNDGGAPVTERGICWNTSTGPSISNSKTTDGTGTGSFSSSMTGLAPGTTYYVRAYATNSAGTAYGNERTFATVSPAPEAPALTTTAITGITQTTASGGGNISGDGGASVTARGVCWNTSTNPTITLSTKTSDGSGTGSFTSSLTGLTAGTTYYVRAYATNSVGTAYGNEVSFTTSSATATLPTLTTAAITEITQSGATSGGNVTSDGGESVTDYGVCWSTSPNPVATGNYWYSGFGTGSFVSYLTGLTANTKYYVRAYATNSIGTAYGNELSFTTSSGTVVVPTLTTTAVSALTSTTVKSGGNISSDGGASVTARGVCWNISANPTIANNTTSDGTDAGIFGSSLTGLTANTTYYVRAYATNSAGTAYGNEISFTTTLQVTDVDGNKYNTVKIGTQLWMQENLKTTLYRDGTAIPNITDNTAWIAQTSGAYSWYNNDQTSYKAAYGALYNFYAAVDNHILCPTGWHVPTTAEWTSLVNYLGGEYAAGGKLKESGTDHWTSPNTGATNETAFSAFAGSFRLEGGFAGNFGYYGFWWSSSEFSSTDAMARLMSYDHGNVYSGNYHKNYGFSVRCLQGEGQVLPFVTTTAASGITSTGAISGGNVTSDGNSTVTERGICWSTSTGPTVALTTKNSDGTLGTGSYTSAISGLMASTTYYVRAYATNSVGTAYGNETSFTTLTSGPIAVNLGTTVNYVILAKAGITNVPTSAITGDLGLSPAASSSITGLSLINFGSYSTSTQVTGKIFAADMSPPTPANLTTAISDMEIAYNDAAGRTAPDHLELGTGEIGGMTLAAGLYKWTTNVTMTSDVTIYGGENDVWIFQISGDLLMSTGVRLNLTGGAQAKNIFWQVAGQATFGTTSHFEGIILSLTGITFQTGASFKGRALAQTGVTLNANNIILP